MLGTPSLTQDNKADTAKQFERAVSQYYSDRIITGMCVLLLVFALMGMLFLLSVPSVFYAGTMGETTTWIALLSAFIGYALLISGGVEKGRNRTRLGKDSAKAGGPELGEIVAKELALTKRLRLEKRVSVVFLKISALLMLSLLFGGDLTPLLGGIVGALLIVSGTSMAQVMDVNAYRLALTKIVNNKPSHPRVNPLQK